VSAARLPDPERVRAFVRDWSGELALRQLEPRYLTAGPDGPVRLLYEAVGPGGETVRLSARRVRPKKGRRIAEELNRRCAPLPGTGGQFARPAAFAPELDLLFHVFPADPRLVSLPTASDAVAIAPLLERALREHAAGARARSVHARVIRYKPERRCLFAYEIRWDRPTGAPSTVYGKLVRAERYARTLETLARLHAASGSLSFDLPEPLGGVAELSLVLFSHVRGVPLSTLRESSRFPELCRQVALGLREFHALPLQLEERYEVRDKLEKLAIAARALEAMRPPQGARARELERELARRLDASGGAARLIHRDFHPENLLVNGVRLGLVDLDDCAMGDPDDDVGYMWAQLVWLAIDAGARRATAERGRRAFLDAYGDRGPPAADAGIHGALQAFLLAYQCLRYPQDRERHSRADALLSACERALAIGLD
jgi:aminoglycoside phosphotransferase (APT) family kinase protein